MSNNIPLPELIKAVSEKDINAMVKRITRALTDRAEYEYNKNPNGSHVELRRVVNWFKDSRSIAAFLHVIGADPQEMFNRQRKNGSRSNLKGLKKVRQLFDYISGRTNAFERVSLAMFASTIIAADQGVSWISSQEQELILSSEQVNSLPVQVRTAIREYQHKHMTLAGDSRNQACSFRTTFANLGIYTFAREDFDDNAYTLGINVNMNSPIVRYLYDRWELNRFNQQ